MPSTLNSSTLLKLTSTTNCQDRLFMESPNLNFSFDDLHHLLQRVPRSSPQFIGIIEETSPDFILAFLVALMQGHDIFLLSKRHPHEQLETIISDAKLAYLVGPRTIENINFSVDFIPFEDLSEFKFGSTHLRPQNHIIFQTSGSTQKSKYVVHTLDTLMANANGVVENSQLCEDSRTLAILPFNHVGGMGLLIRGLLTQSTLVFQDKDISMLDTLIQSQITHVSFVPTQLRALLKSDFSIDDILNLTSVLVGGDRTDYSVVAEAKKRGLPIQLTYGLTEMASQVTTTRLDADDFEMNTSGQLLANTDMTIDHHGEILVRGESLCLGYLNPTQRNNLIDPRDDDGWFHSGDLGYINHKSQLIVTGRIHNIIISGGENIQAEEIETSLMQIEGVDECYVIGTPNNEFGERPIAFIRKSNDIIIAESFVRHSLKLKHPFFMIPDAFFLFPPELENTGIKTSRNNLKEFYLNHSSSLLKAFS